MAMFRGFVLVAIGLMLIPFVGPIVDSHYVERTPSHSHIFFGSTIPVHHLHPYEFPHYDDTHSAAPDQAGNRAPALTSPTDRIVFLSNNTAGVQELATLAPTASDPMSTAPIEDSSALIPLSRGADPLPSDISVPPPKRPPR